ncbi:MAG: DUF2442 domain-containing protein [Acidobacteriota bacterium]|nr:MAG: DUF2442 domain-containing protein [Acidobacteriota bacterium]
MVKVKEKWDLEEFGISDKEFERQYREATKRGEESLKNDPRAVSASYQNGEVTVRLASGWSFSFDPRRYKLLKNATDEQLSDVTLLGSGSALEWPSIDQQLGIGPLVLDLIGEKYISAELGRRKGSVTSDKKKIASRENGKLGGRPRNVG